MRKVALQCASQPRGQFCAPPGRATTDAPGSNCFFAQFLVVLRHSAGVAGNGARYTALIFSVGAGFFGLPAQHRRAAFFGRAKGARAWHINVDNSGPLAAAPARTGKGGAQLILLLRQGLGSFPVFSRKVSRQNKTSQLLCSFATADTPYQNNRPLLYP
ncbi:MAG: hypothetical protein EOP49_29225 [Sphingobacteriales bacterium]|nr:MAG: hypothetical protein EOP49_29225 [Sphingobacteriales bacterium]